MLITSKASVIIDINPQPWGDAFKEQQFGKTER